MSQFGGGPFTIIDAATGRIVTIPTDVFDAAVDGIIYARDTMDDEVNNPHGTTNDPSVSQAGVDRLTQFLHLILPLS